MIDPSSNDNPSGMHYQQELKCPICCSVIYEHEEQIECPNCKVHYHKECWIDNNGCATYGCPSSPEMEKKEIPEVDLRPCPWCLTLLPAKTVICSCCGHRRDEVPPASNHLKDDIVNGLEIIRQKLLLLLHECTPLILYALGNYKKAILKYAVFEGEDSRKEFSSFLSVSFLIVLLLLISPPLAFLYGLGTILPTSASIVRRLRNAGMSPWYCTAIPILLLLLFVPPQKNDVQSKQASN